MESADMESKFIAMGFGRFTGMKSEFIDMKSKFAGMELKLRSDLTTLEVDKSMMKFISARNLTTSIRFSGT